MPQLCTPTHVPPAAVTPRLHGGRPTPGQATRFPRLQPRLQDLPLGTGTVVALWLPCALQAAGQVFSLLPSQGHTQRSESHTGSGLFLILSPAGSYTPHIPFSYFSKPSPPKTFLSLSLKSQAGQTPWSIVGLSLGLQTPQETRGSQAWKTRGLNQAKVGA